MQEEEESVAAMQDDEDLKLYGARSKPAEVIEMDESGDSSLNRGHKRGLSALGPGTLQPASKLFKQDTPGFDSQYFQSDTTNVSCSLMDWNAGPTPLDAWLNQSAIPTPRGSINIARHVDESTDQNHDNAEATDIEVFRRVHIASNTEADIPPPRPSFAAEVSVLELGTQIYFRNIVDRYPSLPTYLALRLAKANQERSQRLQKQRDYHTSNWSPLRIAEFEDLSPCYPIWEESIADSANMLTQPAYALGESTVTAQKRFPATHDSLKERLGTPTLLDNFLTTSGRKASQSTDTGPIGEANFWTGTSRSRRASSVRSGSSSRNSSLRDVPITKVDPFEQSPVFPIKKSDIFEQEPNPVRPSLPPPPKEADSGLPFACDICGRMIIVSRKLDWHGAIVYCYNPLPNESALKQRLPEHCLFCGKTIGERVTDYTRHVGRHMEEIAFAVIPKQYEDWELYSDNSSPWSSQKSCDL
ncbi:MAG: hypothetical protein Q9209_001018 [Squamulea sp. 1 TL-2023]